LSIRARRDKRGKKMTRSIPISLLAALLGGCPSSSTDPAATPAKAPEAPAAKPGAPVGSAAPDFDVGDEAGNRVTMAQHRGKQPVLMAFYPKDFTSG
jgi:hypothetical protein